MPEQGVEPPLEAAVPEVAVVIPTFRRETRLAFALEALAGQTLDFERFEVIVVRAANSSEPKASAPEGLRVRFLEYPGRGRPAAQRNHGWRASEAPLVAFTDDDCRPSAGWLERLLAAARGQGVIVQGRTEPDPDERHLLWGYARSVEVLEPSERYETCNILYPQSLLERLGGFDERFPHPWGEDMDLGLRAVDDGARCEFSADALVWHAVHPRPLPTVLRETIDRNKVPLLARHPAGRRGLHLGLFLYPSHPRLLLALGVALLRPRRPALALAAAVPYATIGLSRREVGLRALARAVWALPGRVLIDTVEIAATVRYAVKHRFPAL